MADELDNLTKPLYTEFYNFYEGVIAFKQQQKMSIFQNIGTGNLIYIGVLNPDESQNVRTKRIITINVINYDFWTTESITYDMVNSNNNYLSNGTSKLEDFCFADGRNLYDFLSSIVEEYNATCKKYQEDELKTLSALVKNVNDKLKRFDPDLLGNATQYIYNELNDLSIEDSIKQAYTTAESEYIEATNKKFKKNFKALDAKLKIEYFIDRDEKRYNELKDLISDYKGKLEFLSVELERLDELGRIIQYTQNDETFGNRKAIDISMQEINEINTSNDTIIKELLTQKFLNVTQATQYMEKLPEVTVEDNNSTQQNTTVQRRSRNRGSRNRGRGHR